MEVSGQLHAPANLQPEKRAPDTTEWAAKLECSRLRREPLPCPYRESNPGQPTRSQVTVQTELSRSQRAPIHIPKGVN